MVLKASDKADIIKLYENRLKRYGVNVMTVGWKDVRQQRLRFKQLTEANDISGKSLLDVGCGFGDLSGYLRRQGITVKYTGYDLSSKLIEIAKRRNPSANFEVKDILSEDFGKFDYIITSGTLNKKLTGNRLYAARMIKTMFEHCRKGIAFNMFTTLVDFKEDYLYYYSPGDILNTCRKLSRKVIMRDNYPLYDFTFHVYR